MVDLELLRRILFDNGITSVDVKGLKLAKKVLTNEEDEKLARKVYFCDDLGVNFDKRRLIDFINYYGEENLYIGERFSYNFSRDVKVNGTPGGEISSGMGLDEVVTIFKHDEHDYYYYDLLDNYKRCERVHPDIFYIRDGCDNLKSLKSILNKVKEKKSKERIK
ncbi:MAG: hypothetical protein HFE81_04860 [Bacilli bacterium]|nr:hypothetical protein [Bacilli bacterium]